MAWNVAEWEERIQRRIRFSRTYYPSLPSKTPPGCSLFGNTYRLGSGVVMATYGLNLPFVSLLLFSSLLTLEAGLVCVDSGAMR